MFIYILLAFAVLSRFVIHIPNFTPVLAMAMFAGMVLPRQKAIVLPIVLMALTDLILGFHSTMFFTWGSMILIAFIGEEMKSKSSVTKVFGGGFFASILFFVISNFGVWLMTGLYPKTFEGFVQCYIMAIPFFKWTFISTCCYLGIFIVSYQFVKQLQPQAVKI